jgi:carbamoyltransferase
MGYNIAMTTGHNATVAVSKDGKLVCAVELERVHPNDKRKNVGFSDVPGTKQGMIDMLKRELPDVDYYDNMLLQHSDVKARVIQYEAHLRFGKIKQIQSNKEHHVAHASGSFYQSPFERAIAISIDGGGNDGVFNLFKMVRGKDPQLITKFPINLGSRYASFGKC